MVWLIWLGFKSSLALLALLGIFCSLTLGICRSTKQLYGQTAIVTGGNAGIGYETAVDLARRGARVILACRNKTKGLAAVKRIVEATGNQSVQMMTVDLANFKSVREFAAEVNNTLDKVDILVNNAGMPPPPPHGEKLSQDKYDVVLQTNHFAPFLLTNLIKDKLMRSSSPRIVNVASFASKMADDKGIEYATIKKGKDYEVKLVYGVSKLMNIYFTNEIVRLWGPMGVQAFSLHPGVVRSEFMSKTEIPELKALPNPVQTIIWGLFVFVCLFITKSSKQGAQTSVFCCLEDQLPNGEYFADCRPAPWYMRNKSNRDTVKEGSKLWQFSEKITGLI